MFAVDVSPPKVPANFGYFVNEERFSVLKGEDVKKRDFCSVV